LFIVYLIHPQQQDDTFFRHFTSRPRYLVLMCDHRAFLTVINMKQRISSLHAQHPCRNNLPYLNYDIYS